jgi:hypothetical protein
VSRVLVVEGLPLFHALRSWRAIQQFSSSLTGLDPRNSLKLPLLPYASSRDPASRSTIQTYLRHVVIALSSPSSSLQDSEILAEARQLLETFLLAGKDRVSKSDLAEWAKRGEEQDRVDEKNHRSWVSIGKRAKSLRTIWVKYRRALIEGGECSFSVSYLSKVADSSEVSGRRTRQNDETRSQELVGKDVSERVSRRGGMGKDLGRVRSPVRPTQLCISLACRTDPS